MKLDARRLEPGHRLQAEVVVLGGGPAGIAVALALGRAGREVLLVEAGGEALDPQLQAHFEPVPIGRAYTMLPRSRGHALGGSTHLWGGHCVAMRPSVLGERPWVPDGAWPLSAEDLAAYEGDAMRFLGVEDAPCSAEVLAARLGETLPALRSAGLQAMPAWYRAESAAALHAEALARVSGLTVLLHAHALALRLGASGAGVREVELQTLTGVELVASGRLFVLALGGIGNAHLLLSSRDVAPAGVGNDHDLVGRYFAEHLWLPWGRLVAGPGAPSLRCFDTPQPRGETAARLHLALHPELQRAHALADYRTELVSPEPGAVARPSARRRLEELMLPPALRRQAQEARELRPMLPGEGARPGAVVVDHVEQLPNRESRVVLGERLDPLGRPRAAVDWRLDERDELNLRTGHRLFARAVAEAGLGQVEVDEPFEVLRERIDGCAHHMGTTRMHRDPRRGVVDPDGKVHGVHNLYAAGSSVFPSGGGSNPTLTLVALALRLARHLDARCDQPREGLG